MLMKRFFLPFVAAALHAGVCLAADWDIHTLHTLSNTMDHNEFLIMAMHHDSLTQSISTEEWYEEIGVTDNDTLGRLMMPTLYDLIVNEFYSSWPSREYDRDSVVKAWLAFHAQDRNILPELYIRLTTKSAIRQDTLYAMYDAAPDTWEKGYLLTRMSDYSSQRFYDYLTDYLQRFPSSPFALMAMNAKCRCERIELDYSYAENLSSSDSVVVTYHNTNAREIVFELYRWPDKWPKHAKAGKALTKVDSVRVTCDLPYRFRQNDRQCAMAPQPYGQYVIYARLPEDSLQTPLDSLDSYQLGIPFFVSDLRCFALNELRFGSVRPWFIVTDVHSGGPVRKVHVKSQRLISKSTNKDGEVSYLPQKAYYGQGTLRKRADKYERFKTGGAWGNFADGAALCMLPNSTLFRPGDTLHMTLVANKRHKFQTALLKNIPISVEIYGRDFKKDTTLQLDGHGSATFDLPFMEDMHRGYYSVFARSPKRKRNGNYVYGYTSIRLEDYRMPTFSVLFDDSCRTIDRDKKTAVTGRVVRANGVPMAATHIKATVRPLGTSLYSGLYSFSDIDTDADGVFRLAWSELKEAEKIFKECHGMRINASVTAPDGETRTADFYVSFTSDGSAPDDEPIRISAVPQDSLLWLPLDSMVTEGNEVTMRLGVPRACWVYCVAAYRDRLVSHEWKQLNAGMHTYTFTLPDKEDDYLDVRFITATPNGGYIERHQHLQGPAQNELHLVPATMRDYLTPSAEETWTFRLTDAKGQAAQGKMVLSMTDKALEALSSSQWENTLEGTRWTNPYTRIDTSFYLPIRRQTRSHIPPQAQAACLYPPVLYAPYRISDEALTIVSGRVVDTDGEPVIGASVTEQGSKNGTVTDYDGYFHLAISKSGYLQFSYIGMKTIVCHAYPNMRLVMEENQDELNEVVVTGYGNTKSVVIRGIGSISSGQVYGFRSKNSNKIESADVLDVVAEEEEEVVYAVVGQKNVNSDALSMPLREGDTRLALYMPALQTDANGEMRVHFTTPPDNTEWLVQALAWSDKGTSDYMRRTVMARRTLMLRLQLPRYMRQGDAISLACVLSNTADTARQTKADVFIRDAVTDSLLETREVEVLIPANGSETLFVPYTAGRQADIVVTARVSDGNGCSDGEKRLLRVLPLDERVSECVPFYMHDSDTAITLRLPAPPASENRQVELMLCDDPLAYIAAQLPTEIDSSAVTVTRMVHNFYALSLRNKIAAEYPSLIQPVDLNYLISNLRQFQRGSGAFSWLQNYNSYASYFLTLRVLFLLGELQQADALDSRLNSTRRDAVAYIDREAIRYEREYRKVHHDSLPNYLNLEQYAIVRALFDDKMDEDIDRIFHAVLDSVYAHPNTEELTVWPLLALTFERAGQHERALAFINGLRRYAAFDREHGMYWNNLPDRWWWYSQSEIQATFLLAFATIDPQAHELEALRQWLILNNRTTDWGKSSMNAFVTYAMMQNAPKTEHPKTELQVISLPDTTVTYTLHRTSKGPAWGALMSTYSAPADQLQAFATRAMKIERRFERINTTLPPHVPLAKGDRIRVTLTVTTDREMDNVIITDRRPAVLEPRGRSGCSWKDNVLGYHEIRNTEECFYVEHLQRGTTELTYECYVTASGISLAGLATAVSDIAPEFTSHTATDCLTAE